MKPFKKVKGVMAYLPIANVDTDMIIPKQYMRTLKRSGLGVGLFEGLRYDKSHQLNSDFILNQPEFKKTKILVSGENFGCGSSREHAVWSLLDYGIKVIIAPSFADIFYNNCFKDGLLPIILSKSDIQKLLNQNQYIATVDLQAQTISIDTLVVTFSMDAWRRESLLKGLDEIDDTLAYLSNIRSFEKEQSEKQPWLYKEIFHG